jgi:hypothetical protein
MDAWGQRVFLPGLLCHVPVSIDATSLCPVIHGCCPLPIFSGMIFTTMECLRKAIFGISPFFEHASPPDQQRGDWYTLFDQTNARVGVTFTKEVDALKELGEKILQRMVLYGRK